MAYPVQEYCLLWVQWWPLCMSRGDWASWMQAVGSVLAVAAAIGVVGWDIQHRRIARAIEEVQRLQMIWTFAYHCRVEMQYAKESAHLPSPEAFHVPNGLRQKVAALRHVPALELLEPAVAVAVLTVIEAYEVFDLAIPQVPGVSRPQSSDYIRAQATTAFKNFDFAERELRGVLKRRRADVPPGIYSMNGVPYPPLDARS